jgi:hypothetical protein
MCIDEEKSEEKAPMDDQGRDEWVLYAYPT